MSSRSGHLMRAGLVLLFFVPKLVQMQELTHANAQPVFPVWTKVKRLPYSRGMHHRKHRAKY